MSLKILGSKRRKFLRFLREAVRRRLPVEGPELLDPPSPAIRSMGWDLLARCWSFGERVLAATNRLSPSAAPSIALNVKAAHQPADAICRGHQLTRNDRPWLLS